MSRWKIPFASLATRLGLIVLAAGFSISLGISELGGSVVASAIEPGPDLGRVILGVGLGVSLIAALVAYWIASAVLHPINLLVDAARRISEGEAGVELPSTQSDDEISQLSKSFAEMKERLYDRARKLEESQRNVEEVNQRLRAQNAELQGMNEVLEQLSITDGLTKLHNHRFFHEHLAREVKRADRSTEPLSLVLVDIDHFKQWNDRLGHAAGDEILRRVADVMNRLIRETDVLARYGGEEFALIAPNTETAGAIQLAEKIRSTIAQTNFVIELPSESHSLTVSIGVALYRDSGTDLFNQADRALYSAKEQGRDCVVVADVDG
jgi:diguanylate cyclase (GGDEF)-like protein